MQPSDDDNDKAADAPPALIELPNDPLNWFGLLTPTSLQHAQTTFTSVIERAVELCNLKRELQNSLEQFEEMAKLAGGVELVGISES